MKCEVNKMNLNQISFLKHNKVAIPSGSAFLYQDNLPKIQSFLNELKGLNFVVNPALIMALASYNEEQCEEVMNHILSLAKESVGDKGYKTFYNEPIEDIAKKEPIERYIDQVLHYVLRYNPNNEAPVKVDDVVGSLKELTVQAKFKIITLTENGYFENLLANLISTKVALSETDSKIITDLLNQLNPAIINNALSESEISFKEVMAQVVGDLVNNGKIKKVSVLPIVKTATDILRVVNYIQNGSAIVDENMPLKLSNPQRKFILDALEGMSNPEEDLVRYKKIWRDIAKLTHAKRSTHPNCVKYFEVVFDKRKVWTLNSVVEPLLSDYKESYSLETLKELLKALSKRPSELGRRLDVLYRTAGEPKNENAKQHLSLISLEFSKVAPDISSRVLYQMANHFINRQNERLVQVSGKLVFLDGQEDVLSKEILEATVESITDALLYQYSQLEPLGKVFIDERLDNISISTSERSSSKGASPLTSYSKIPLDVNGDKLRLFLFWKDLNLANPINMFEDRVDADLSMLFLDENFKTVIECGYTNLNTSVRHNNGKEMSTIAVHSGDITSAPKGAMEYVDVDLAKIRDTNVRYGIASVHAYTDQKFSDMEDIRSGFMLLNAEEFGRRNRPYDARTVQQSNDLTAQSRSALLFLIDFKEMTYTWLDVNNNVASETPNNNFEYRDNLELVAKHFGNHKPTSVKDVYELHAKVRGTIVDNIEDADVVFSLPNDSYTLDINDFVANWL